jgi:hypothetical protein
MYFMNRACAADNSVWVLPTASFDLEHALSGCKSALGVAARRGVWGFKSPFCLQLVIPRDAT